MNQFTLSAIAVYLIGAVYFLSFFSRRTSLPKRRTIPLTALWPAFLFWALLMLLLIRVGFLELQERGGG